MYTPVDACGRRGTGAWADEENKGGIGIRLGCNGIGRLDRGTDLIVLGRLFP